MSRLSRTVFITLAALLAAAAGSTALMAQTKPKITTLGPDFPRTEIFIGNSFFYYNNSMHSHVLALERAADPAHKQSYRATSVTISGSGFDWHDVASYFRPNAIGNYSFDEQNNVVFNKLEKLFDVAIMMDCSQCPIHPKLKTVFTDFAKKGSEAARKTGCKAGVLHVMGLCRQAGDDRATGRGVYDRRQRQ